MAKIPSSNPTGAPRIRRSLTLFYALPLLCGVGVFGYLLYGRVTHAPSPDRVISSEPFMKQKIGGLTASLFTQGNQLQASGNDLFLEFRDAQGELTNVGKVSLELSLTMPGMVMHSLGKVFATATPGRYRTTIEPQMGGDWSARLAFQSAGGDSETNFYVKVK